MTDNEIEAYFENAILPEQVRLDRATTQLNVVEAVKRNLEMMRSNPKDRHSRHRLRRIIEGIENPYDGPEIPRF